MGRVRPRRAHGRDAVGLDGPVDRWRALRDEIHREVCEQGFDAERGAFTQSYGSQELDASLLMMPLVGFLPADDPRVRGTVEAIERELRRTTASCCATDSGAGVDGLPPGEGAFLPCTFWLADCLALLGRHDEARALFERLLALATTSGCSRRSTTRRRERLLGNFPQAFTHLALVNSAFNVAPHLPSPMRGATRTTAIDM